MNGQSLNLRWLALGGQTLKNWCRLVCKFESQRKSWANWIAGRPKFSTCSYLRVRLARVLGSISSRCSGNELTFLPRTHSGRRPHGRERRKSNLTITQVPWKMAKNTCRVWWWVSEKKLSRVSLCYQYNNIIKILYLQYTNKVYLHFKICIVCVAASVFTRNLVNYVLNISGFAVSKYYKTISGLFLHR